MYEIVITQDIVVRVAWWLIGVVFVFVLGMVAKNFGYWAFRRAMFALTFLCIIPLLFECYDILRTIVVNL